VVTVTNFVIPETPVGAVVEKLATCLCAQILADGLPPPCQCGVIAGAGVSTDVGHRDEADRRGPPQRDVEDHGDQPAQLDGGTHHPEPRRRTVGTAVVDGVRGPATESALRDFQAK